MEANNDKVWERPWTTEEIRQNSGNWNLAGDAGLLGHLQQFSQTLVARTHAINKALDSQFEHLNRLSINIDNQTNDLSNLCNTQFVENRVYEDQEIDTLTEGPLDGKKNVSKEEEYIANVKKALRIGMSVLDTHFHEVDVEDTDGEDDSSSSVGGKVLLAKDPYSHRPLPHLIGSREFMEDDSVGLAEILSDSEDIPTPRLTADSSDSDQPRCGERHSRGSTSESEGSDAVDNVVFRRNSDRMFDEEPSDMFGQTDEAPAAHSNSQASFADELASKLGGVASQAVVQSPASVAPAKQLFSKPDDLFSPGGEDSDELDDSLFGVGKGRFSGGRGLFDDLEEEEQKKEAPVTVASQARVSKPTSLFADDMFGSVNDDGDDLFSTNKKATSVDKPPIGGQRHLGIPQGQPFGPVLKSTSDPEKDDVFKTENANTGKSTSNLFDDDNEDDLFAVGTKSSSKNISNEPKKVPTILSLPSSKSTDVSNVSSRITRSIYLPDDSFEQPNSSRPSNDFLQSSLGNSSKVDNTASARKFDLSSSSTSDNASESLFGKPKESTNKTVNEKSLSLFDESDSGEEEVLFSTHSSSKRSLNSPSSNSKNSLSFEPNKEKARSSLFENTNSGSLFSSDDLFKEATVEANRKTDLFDFDDVQDDIFAVTLSNKRSVDRSILFPESVQPTDRMTPPKSLNIRKSMDLFNEDDDNDTDDLFNLPVDKKVTSDKKPTADSVRPRSADCLTESSKSKIAAPKIQWETEDSIDIFDETQNPSNISSVARTISRDKAPKPSPRKVEPSEKPTIGALPKVLEAQKLPKMSPIFVDSVEEDDLFSEPVKSPEVAKRKPPVVQRSVSNQNTPEIVHSQSISNAAETAKSPEPEKIIGKIKTPVGLLIDPKTMLPGARPPRESHKEAQSPTEISVPGQGSPKSDRLSSHSFVPATVKIAQNPSTEGEEIKTPSNNTLEFIFNTPIEVTPILHSAGKERAKIQVKRRPQSRKARQEAIRTSAIFPDQPEQGTSKEEDDMFHRVEPSSSKDQVAKILPIQSTSKVPKSLTSDSFNPTSPSTDEEDLFGVPQDLYESSTVSDSLFGDSKLLSPRDSASQSKSLFEKSTNKPLGLFDNVQPSNESSALLEEKKAESHGVKPSGTMDKKADDRLLEARSKPISLFGENGYIGDKMTATERVEESLSPSRQIDSSSSAILSRPPREVKSVKDARSPLGLFDDLEDLFSSHQHSMFQKEGVFDEESDSLFYTKKSADKTENAQDNMFPAAKKDSFKTEGIFDKENDLFLPKLEETFKETKGATRKQLKDDLFQPSNKGEAASLPTRGVMKGVKDPEDDKIDAKEAVFRTSKNTIVFDDENDDFLFPAASGSLQEAFNDSKEDFKDVLFQNQENLFTKTEEKVSKKVDFSAGLFTDDDDSLFTSTSVKKTKPEEVKVKAGSSKIKKIDINASLFGDDDEIEDIFNISTVKSVPAKKTVDTTIRKTNASTRPVKTTEKDDLFEDPLMALQK